MSRCFKKEAVSAYAVAVAVAVVVVVAVVVEPPLLSRLQKAFQAEKKFYCLSAGHPHEL